MTIPFLDAGASLALAAAVIAFNKFIIVYFTLINLGYVVIFFLSMRSLWKFSRRNFFADYEQICQSELAPPISLLVPAHNEARTIVESLRSLLQLNYSEYTRSPSSTTLTFNPRAYAKTPPDGVFQEKDLGPIMISLRPVAGGRGGELWTVTEVLRKKGAGARPELSF